MTEYKQNPAFRGIYAASFPATKQAVTCSDVFYETRHSVERNQVFKTVFGGVPSDNLNVNTDKLRHRPSDIIDHVNRALPLPSLRID